MCCVVSWPGIGERIMHQLPEKRDTAETGAQAEGVDRTLLRENLKLTVTERFRKHRKIAQFVERLRIAGQRSREKQ
jgi:hypothetical protein